MAASHLTKGNKSMSNNPRKKFRNLLNPLFPAILIAVFVLPAFAADVQEKINVLLLIIRNIKIAHRLLPMRWSNKFQTAMSSNCPADVSVPDSLFFAAVGGAPPPVGGAPPPVF